VQWSNKPVGFYMQNKKEKILFHIITPSYNRPELLQRAVDSVLKQDDHKWNLHIVDDGSSEKTLAYLRHINMIDPRIMVYFLQKNQGVNFVRNFALNRILEQFSEGYVTFLDDDDQLVDSCLSNIEEQIMRYPSYKWFIGNCINLTGEVITKIKCYGRGNYIDDYVFSSKLRGDAIHIISLSAISQSRFTEEFRNSEEWVWFLQIAKNTDYFSFNKNLKLVDYQVDGLSAKKVNRDKKLKVFLLKEQLCLDLKPAYLAEQRTLLAREYFRENDFKIGMQKLKQTFSQRWWTLKWYQILFYGLYRRLRA